MEQEAHTPCTNCEHPFTGNFCPNCGQSIKIYERPFPSIVKEFLGDLFAFDSRFWRSIPALIYKPGTMISEYVGGKHGLYVPPFRLYVFISFIFFLLLENLAVNGIEANKDEIISAISRDSSETKEVNEFAQDNAILHSPVKDTSVQAEKPEAVNIQINGKDEQAKFKEIISDPAKYIVRFNKNLSWSFFLLMPLLGFLLWVFFRKNRPYYVPPFLYALQLHTLLFLVLSILIGLQLLFSDQSRFSGIWLTYLLPVHAVAGARKLYSVGWVSAFIRLTFATFLYLIFVFASAVLTAIYIFTS